MAKRLNNTSYMLSIFKFVDGNWMLISNEDGTLFSGHHKTKIRPTDLPEWYLYGSYYKSWGYMSTKGIVDMVYRPNMHVNHFLRDDFLYISYKEKIEPTSEKDKEDRYLRYKYYKGYDEVVCGSEIIDILKGARQYSNFDIKPIIDEIREKEKWLRYEYPDEFSQERWVYDIDKVFAEDISSIARKRSFINSDKNTFYGLNLYNYFAPSCCSSIKTYFGNLDEIRSFVEALGDTGQYKETKAAFTQYLEGNMDATHYIAFNHHRLIETVEFIMEKVIKIENTKWEFLNVWGWPHYMEIDSGTVKMVLLKKGKKYMRAIKASVRGLRTCIHANTPKDTCLELRGTFWGHPCLLVVNEKDNTYVVNSTLYMKEKEYKTKKEAIEKFHTDPVSLNCLCEDVFGDG